MEPSVEITPELLAGFIDEADEYLVSLGEMLMQIEEEAAAGPLSFAEGEKLDLMNVMFRAAHSLKGLSGAFGFAEMNSLNHRMETLFDEARMGKRALDSHSIEALLNAQGVIQSQVEQLRESGIIDIDVTESMSQLQAVLDSDATAGEQPADTESEEQSDTTVDTEPTEAAGEQPEAPGGSVPASVLDDPELRAIFIQTTEEDVEELSQKLLKIEEAMDEELATEVFRIAHTIKGACGAAGLSDAHDLTHRMETLLDQIRGGQITINDGLMSTLFAVTDRLRAVVEEVKQDRYVAWGEDQICALFGGMDDKAADGVTGQADSSAAPMSASGSDAFEIPPEMRTGQSDMLAVRVEFDPDNPESVLQPYLISNKLKDLGAIVYSDPDMDKDSGDEQITTLKAVVAVDHCDEDSVKVLQELLASFEVASVAVSIVRARQEQDDNREPHEVEAVQAKSPESPAADKKEPANTKKPASKTQKKPAGAQKAPLVQETVRVDVERLDQLMNLGGELVINRSQFSQIERKFRGVFECKDQSFVADDITQRLEMLQEHVQGLKGQNDAACKTIGDLVETISQDFTTIRGAIKDVEDQRPAMHNLSEAVNTLGRISDTMQKQIMGTRMVPVGPLFTRFKRVVRDIAKSLGKKIDYQIVGEHTELDKKMIDELGDPLTHMIRNSADHGIESSDDRIKAGKDPVGVVKIEAYHQGNTICIRLSDDGKGIDVEAVRRKIVDQEIVTESQASQLTDKELVQYIFHPGMTTAKTVSDVSGRGMGMDIVISKITNLNGTVEVDSVVGEGTTVTIKLPLTLAIITSLLSKIGGEVYAIPLEAVNEIVTVSQGETNSIQGKKVIIVRERVIPVYLLEQLLETDQVELKTHSRDSKEWTLVILGEGAGRLGLVVDELLGQEDIVIKSLAENYANVPGFAGATIMGDGRVALILDPLYLQADGSRRLDTASEEKVVQT